MLNYFFLEVSAAAFVVSADTFTVVSATGGVAGVVSADIFVALVSVVTVVSVFFSSLQEAMKAVIATIANNFFIVLVGFKLCF